MFPVKGISVLVDGQYGSTGKGLFASYLAHNGSREIDCVITSAGPNSGHTFYFGEEQHVLKQLPTFAVYQKLMGIDPMVYLAPSAVINPLILNAEASKYDIKVLVASTAAIVTPEDAEAEGSGSIAEVAGTRQGVGAALMRKLARNPNAIARAHKDAFHPLIKVIEYIPGFGNYRILFEVAQGYSLGLNDAFYPKVTSRECTVAQALADIRVSPLRFGCSFMSIRTFPIRVGNVDGYSSGDCYPDQEEITWEKIGVKPELTTVTKRVRRIFTFSRLQYADALKTNTPRCVLANFLNYLPKNEQPGFVKMLNNVGKATLGYSPKLYFGYGPKVSDVYEELQ